MPRTKEKKAEGKKKTDKKKTVKKSKILIEENDELKGEGLKEILNYAKDGLKKIHNYVKDNKLISKGLKTYSASNPTSTLGGLSFIGSEIADKLGYGQGLKKVKISHKKKIGGSKKTPLQKGLMP